jgi:hypothetical protein
VKTCIGQIYHDAFKGFSTDLPLIAFLPLIARLIHISDTLQFPVFLDGHAKE